MLSRGHAFSGLWQGALVLALAAGCQPAGTPPIRTLPTSVPAVQGTTEQSTADQGTATQAVLAGTESETDGQPPRRQPKPADKPPAPAGADTPDAKAADALRQRGARVTLDKRSGAITQIFAGRRSSPLAKVTADDVHTIAALSRVSILYLDGIGMDDADALKLSGLRNIISLDVSDNNITDEGLAVIRQFPSLDILNVSNTKVADETICAIAKTAGLRAFWANNTQMTDRGAECIAQIHSLMHLHMAGTKLSNVGLAQLTQLRGLLELELARTSINDDGLALLAALPSLRELDLSGCAIRGPGLVSLQALPLEWLKLNDTPLTDDAIPALSSIRKNILVIELRGTQITPDGFERIKKAFPNSSIRH